MKISIRNPTSIRYNGMQQINGKIKYVRLPASYFYSNKLLIIPNTYYTIFEKILFF